MRSLTLIGILLTALGWFMLFQGLTYSCQRSVLKLGTSSLGSRRTAVPAWLGGLALVGGLVWPGGRPTGTWPVTPNERMQLSGRPQLMRGVLGGTHQHSAVPLGRVGWI